MAQHVSFVVALVVTVAVNMAAVAAASSLTKVLLSAPSAAAPGGKCLDGTSAGYYIDGNNPDLFAIYLEGGGACYSKESCESRAKTSLGSSKGWPATHQGSGVYSGDASANPDFYNATRVYVPYCTGDVHGGQRKEPSPGTWNLWFDGHLNFLRIISDLKANHGLGKATQVLLTGSSAGGIGTMGNADTLKDLLPNARVWAAPQAGWFYPGDCADEPTKPWSPPSYWQNWSNGKIGGPNLTLTAELWQSYIDPKCTAKEQPPQACGSAHVYYKYIETPLLILEQMYDRNQLVAQLGMPEDGSNPQVLEFVRYYGEAMRNSTRQVYASPKPHDGIFLASCFDHGGIGVGSHITIDSVSVTALLGDWFFQRNKINHRVSETCEDTLPCNPTCDSIGPDQGGCLKTLESLCGKWSSKHQCLSCAQEHAARLRDAGCTVQMVEKDCSQ